MKRAEIVSIIKQGKIVTVLRMKDQTAVPTAKDKLINGGIRILEITSNTISEMLTDEILDSISAKFSSTP